MSAIPCRLCGGQSTFRFEGPILRKYTVKYYRCASCESLETEQPYWVDEAYADKSNLLDVGRVQRTQLVAMLAAHILGGLGLKEQGPCLDWGGAEGLLCRMLRDRGFPFLTYDRYADAPFTPAYKIDDPSSITPVALTSVEVLEHLPEPLAELNEMFRNKPRVALFTTELYNGEGVDWTYLAPINGRHVFSTPNAPCIGSPSASAIDTSDSRSFTSSRASTKQWTNYGNAATFSLPTPRNRWPRTWPVPMSGATSARISPNSARGSNESAHNGLAPARLCAYTSSFFKYAMLCFKLAIGSPGV